MLSMCLLFCFVLFWILCCVVCKKNENKKLLITKKKLGMAILCSGGVRRSLCPAVLLKGVVDCDFTFLTLVSV